MEIKVLGPGCARCRETEQLVSSAVQEAGITASVEKVTDFREMMSLGVMATPAVVIDGRVMCTGRVPSKDRRRFPCSGISVCDTVFPAASRGLCRPPAG